MDPEPNKFRLQHKQRQEEEITEQQSAQQVPREFASVEDMLRYDASQTTPPPAIAERLRESQQAEPRKSWWQRLFKKQEPI